jgi:hypothetical protein
VIAAGHHRVITAAIFAKSARISYAPIAFLARNLRHYLVNGKRLTRRGNAGFTFRMTWWRAAEH